MNVRKSSRSKRHDSQTLEQSTFLLPSPSEDSLNSLWEVDSDIEQDNPSEISFRPAQRQSGFRRDADKDGENSRRPSGPVQRSPSQQSLAESEEPGSLSRAHTAERDLERKKSKRGFRLGKSKDDKIIDKETKRNERKEKKGKEGKEKRPKQPLGQILRHKLSLQPHKDRTKDNHRPQSKHGFSVSTDPVNVYNVPTETDSRGRVRTSQHMTAEVKLHFWRDKYEGEGRVERFLRSIHRKRFRRVLKTAIDLQAASLGSLRSHSRRRRD
ncbi:hypothetical protein TWF225_001355 [Orbilia oligospora]|uniref:Uncharacterized protein n=1 Tax=Orbilia oligospora TaxID=2813651 RepID=A0A7C8P465_ORBOL|nr:hypothetical protein TWF751_008892 [Orbilia oligospora]KAF3191195.1 hypothetical protein TWF225_001355 [Orbilia oligospora]KAF3238719.1 hypothetical protein TWF128_011971 [Orbilia oligospora]KAF3249651.1 hypothetical protein TWF217_008847 [Orbilia oligospora]KAF3279301.1 hypothetical protein TWF132_000665 [Orbilia oligospora]